MTAFIATDFEAEAALLQEECTPGWLRDPSEISETPRRRRRPKRSRRKKSKPRRRKGSPADAGSADDAAAPQQPGSAPDSQRGSSSSQSAPAAAPTRMRMSVLSLEQAPAQGCPTSRTEPAPEAAEPPPEAAAGAPPQGRPSGPALELAAAASQGSPPAGSRSTEPFGAPSPRAWSTQQGPTGAGSTSTPVSSPPPPPRPPSAGTRPASSVLWGRKSPRNAAAGAYRAFYLRMLRDVGAWTGRQSALSACSISIPGGDAAHRPRPPPARPRTQANMPPRPPRVTPAPPKNMVERWLESGNVGGLRDNFLAQRRCCYARAVTAAPGPRGSLVWRTTLYRRLPRAGATDG
eukprot:TRINITY_DN5930_c1_g1_i2.p2 TRINITY_DN5930_c1_g1~~TRINITY_DN5930_c1_g1_i2.p2  ORF type:complete len:348 (+),score=58.97 TRINITY_DN5930_c1_g1_i2:68-1111(+)